jgi:cytochrome c peroxidase
MKLSILHFLILFSSIALTGCADEYKDLSDYSNKTLIAKRTLGKRLFSETSLSNPGGQACISCHAPEAGFSDPLHRMVSPGVDATLFGSRNAPSLAYNVFAPLRYYNSVDETFVGGIFLDGRAQDLPAQVLGPLLNPVEMNNTSIEAVAAKIRNLSYFDEFSKIYGNAATDAELVHQLADAIAAFEKSPEVSSFTSKFDYVSRGMMAFSADELKGFNLFSGKANCAACHVLDEDPMTGKVLFTDFSYDNIGVPKNANNPFYNMPSAHNPQGASYIDLGIGQVVNAPQHNGKFKVPTLRNIAVSAPYFHNGVFNTLDEVIRFYNRRKVENLGTPETPANVNTDELGDLKLTEAEEQQLKKFLETLTDHYRP